MKLVTISSEQKGSKNLVVSIFQRENFRLREVNELVGRREKVMESDGDYIN